MKLTYSKLQKLTFTMRQINGNSKNDKWTDFGV